MMLKSIFIGFDPREASAYAVARSSARRHLTQAIPIYGIVLDKLIAMGLYDRPTKIVTNSEGRGQLVDLLSARAEYDGRISTEHAIARFLVPRLAGHGWALFMDGDVLVRGNLARIFDGLDDSRALYCVKHDHHPVATSKMDGQLQTQYERKNWSSVMLFNVDHPSNAKLTLEMINNVPGRDLHRFCWLQDDEIGELDPKWNWLAGYSNPEIKPWLVHFTSGVPDMPGYEIGPYTDEWRAELAHWAASYPAALAARKTG
jgi:hypothetical protein